METVNYGRNKFYDTGPCYLPVGITQELLISKGNIDFFIYRNQFLIARVKFMKFERDRVILTWMKIGQFSFGILIIFQSNL
jgi:hypothetical protein